MVAKIYPKLDFLLTKLTDAGDSGLSKTEITKMFAGTSRSEAKAKREGELNEKLDALVRSGEIRGPVSRKGAKVYFASGCGLSIETPELGPGTKLPSKGTRTKKVYAKLDDFLPELIKAGDNGLAKTAIKEKFTGESKKLQTELNEKLNALVRSGEIRGPVKRKGANVYFARGCGLSIKTAKLDDLLPALIDAGDSGLGIGKIKEKFLGKPKAKAKEREGELTAKLSALVRRGVIRGPLKHGGTKYYFASGCGPSIDMASGMIVTLAQRSGVKLLSKAGLEKKVVGMNKRFFADGLKHSVSSQRIVELSCGSSKYYLHRDVASEYFGFATASGETGRLQERPVPASLALEDILPAYRRLKAENGGFSAVNIYDLQQALHVPKEQLHRLLTEEARGHRVSIHHTTSVDLPPEVVDGGIRLPGVAEPFITVVVKGEQ